MKVKDFNRLAKMMALTFSESDGECLSAIRQANKILTNEGLDWDRVFKRLVTLETEAYEEPKTLTEKEKTEQIEAAFEKVIPTLKDGSFRNFILDLQKQWEDRGSLSVAQTAALFKAASR